MATTVGTLKHRTVVTGTNNPLSQVSKDPWNDSLVVASAAADGLIMVKDSANPDGWGFTAAPAMTSPALTTPTVTTSLVLTRSALVQVPTDGIVLQTATAATAAVPVQIAPRLRFRSNVWNTTVTAATKTDDWSIDSLPVNGAIPSGQLRFGSSLNGATYTYPAILTSGGNLTLLGSLNLPSGASIAGGATSTLSAALALSATQATTAAELRLSTAVIFQGFASGKMVLFNDTRAAGVGLDVTTDGTLKVQTKTLGGYGSVDALGYKASGAAGASFGPAAVASITVVNGIVTAIS